jgi:ribosomal protein L37AE/L43A
MVLDGFRVFEGEWRSPACGSSRRKVLSRSDRDVPECPKCGVAMEGSGTGDDDPYPDDPELEGK